MSTTIDRRELLDRCVELKKIPRLFRKVEAFWGYPEFFEFADSLLLVEKERQHRDGFNEAIYRYREIAELRQFFVEHPKEVRARDLAAPDIAKLEKQLELEHERALLLRIR